MQLSIIPSYKLGWSHLGPLTMILWTAGGTTRTVGSLHAILCNLIFPEVVKNRYQGEEMAEIHIVERLWRSGILKLSWTSSAPGMRLLSRLQLEKLHVCFSTVVNQITLELSSPSVLCQMFLWRGPIFGICSLVGLPELQASHFQGVMQAACI